MPESTPTPPARPAAVIVRAVIGLAALGVAVAIFAILKATQPTPALAPVEQTVRQVRVLTVQPAQVARAWLGYGTARALRSATVAAEIQGVIVERPASIEPGLSVEYGDILVVFDPADFIQRATQLEQAIGALRAELRGLDAEEASLSNLLEFAEAATALQQREIERWRAAAARSAGAPVELERLERDLSRVQREEQALRERLSLVPSRRARAEAQIGAEQAALALARRDLDRTRVIAPLSGSIQSVSVDRGERVAPGAALARIVDLSRIEVPLLLPVSAAADVQPGDRAEIRAEGPIAAVWTGVVARVAPEADAASRSITVYVEIAQPREPRPGDGPRLMPGMFVSGRIYSESPHAELVVPRNAIDRDTALVVGADGVVSAAPVSIVHYLEASLPHLDPHETQWAVIGAGLSPGQRVVLSNLDELRPGAQVEAVEIGAAEGGAQ